MRKRIYITGLAFLAGLALYAQDQFDALRISQSDISGTARYMSMGGAFGALGGDASAISDNPAGLGVYRSSEFSFSLAPQFQNVTGNWNGNVEKRNNAFLNNFNHASFVINTPTKNKVKGLVSSNFSFQYKRLKDFDRKVNIQGNGFSTSLTDQMAVLTSGLDKDDMWKDGTYDPWENTDIGWLSILAAQGNLIAHSGNADDEWHSILLPDETVEASYVMHEQGALDEYGFSWAGNISHKVYVGAVFNLRSYDYRLNSVYGENFSEGGDFSLTNELYTAGSGVNLGVGVIARPTNFLRLGLAFQSPTWMILTESNYSKIETDIENKNRRVSTPGSPTSSFNLRTPLKVNASAAFVMGRVGLLSLEYNFENYADMLLRDPYAGRNAFDSENTYIDEDVLNVHTVKAGLEFNITANFALRAGYAFQTAANRQSAYRTPRLNAVRTDMEYSIDKGRQYASAGVGYRNKNWVVDLAYQYKTQNNTFYAFDVASAAELRINSHNIVMTLGYRF